MFVEAKTGKVISEEGRSIIVDDPTGEKFPWKPKPFTEIIADAKFIDQNEQEITWEQLQGKVTGFFFSAYRVKLMYHLNATSEIVNYDIFIIMLNAKLLLANNMQLECILHVKMHNFLPQSFHFSCRVI